jgi:hypothetical protein
VIHLAEVCGGLTGKQSGLSPFPQSLLICSRTARLSALLYFAQSLFLVFAAVYIAKESIEQVVLGSGAHEHGSHGHGEVVIDGDER